MSSSRLSARAVVGAPIGSETVTLPALANSNVTGTVLPNGRSPVSSVITRLIVPTTSGVWSSVVVTTGAEVSDEGGSPVEVGGCAPVVSDAEDSEVFEVSEVSDDGSEDGAFGLSAGRTTCSAKRAGIFAVPTISTVPAGLVTPTSSSSSAPVLAIVSTSGASSPAAYALPPSGNATLTSRSTSLPTWAILPFTAGSISAVWATWPAPQPTTPSSALTPTATAGSSLRSGRVVSRLTIAVLPRACLLRGKTSASPRHHLGVVNPAARHSNSDAGNS